MKNAIFQKIGRHKFFRNLKGTYFPPEGDSPAFTAASKDLINASGDTRKVEILEIHHQNSKPDLEYRIGVAEKDCRLSLYFDRTTKTCLALSAQTSPKVGQSRGTLERGKFPGDLDVVADQVLNHFQGIYTYEGLTAAVQSAAGELNP